MTLLTKEQIFKADDVETRDVEVPEWGGTVRVSMMTGSARDSYEAGLYQSRKGDQENFENLRARYLSYCVVNDDGKLMFTAKDLIKLGTKSAFALDRVFSVASELNGTSEDGMEEVAKN